MKIDHSEYMNNVKFERSRYHTRPYRDNYRKERFTIESIKGWRQFEE